jgi:hypothetical protein
MFSQQQVSRWTAFWDIVLCSLIEVDQCFGGAYCLHHKSSTWYAPLKHQSTSIRLHGAMSQKVVTFKDSVVCLYLEDTANGFMCNVVSFSITSYST